MRAFAALARNPIAIALVASLAIAGCASKKTPNSAADLGLNAAPPGRHRAQRRRQLTRSLFRGLQGGREAALFIRVGGAPAPKTEPALRMIMPQTKFGRTLQS